MKSFTSANPVLLVSYTHRRDMAAKRAGCPSSFSSAPGSSDVIHCAFHAASAPAWATAAGLASAGRAAGTPAPCASTASSAVGSSGRPAQVVAGLGAGPLLSSFICSIWALASNTSLEASSAS